MPIPKAQYKLNTLIKDLKDKDTKELRKKFEYQSKDLIDNIDWTSYTKAQIEELDNQLILIRKLVEEAARSIWNVINPEGREGRPPKSALDKAKAILIQQYFMSTDRFTSGLVWFLREKLNIHEKLTPKDIERAYDDSDAIAILMEIFRMTNEIAQDKETEFSIDGSGLPTSIKQNYANDRDDEKKRAVYHMLINMVGVEMKLITAYDVTNHTGGESPYLEPLLWETGEIYRTINAVMGDAGFLSRPNCTAIADIGAVPYLFPKEGITLKKKKSAAWKKMLLSLIKNPQKWLREYHKRSISESVNSVWKRKFLRPLARENEDRRKVEVLGRVVTYNIRRLSYLHCLGKLVVPWLGT